jgi:hypothetical protein
MIRNLIGSEQVLLNTGLTEYTSATQTGEPSTISERMDELKKIDEDLMHIVKIDQEKFSNDVRVIIQQETIQLSRRINESVDELIRTKIMSFFNNQFENTRSLFDETHSIEKPSLAAYDPSKKAILTKYIDLNRPFPCFKTSRQTVSENTSTVFTENFILQEKWNNGNWMPSNVLEIKLPFNLLLFYKTVSRMTSTNDVKRFESLWKTHPEHFLDKCEYLEKKYKTELEKIGQIQAILNQEREEIMDKVEKTAQLEQENKQLKSQLEQVSTIKTKREAESDMLNKYVSNLSLSVGNLQEKYEKRIADIQENKKLIELECEKLREQNRLLALTATELKREKLELIQAVEEHQKNKDEFGMYFSDFQEYKREKQAFEREKSSISELKRVLTLIKEQLDKDKMEFERERFEYRKNIEGPKVKEALGIDDFFSTKKTPAFTMGGRPPRDKDLMASNSSPSTTKEIHYDIQFSSNNGAGIDSILNS